MKDSKDTSVGLLSCTSQSCQASLLPRQKLQNNVLNARIETRSAPSLSHGNGMTPAAGALYCTASPRAAVQEPAAQKCSSPQAKGAQLPQRPPETLPAVGGGCILLHARKPASWFWGQHELFSPLNKYIYALKKKKPFCSREGREIPISKALLGCCSQKLTFSKLY